MLICFLERLYHFTVRLALDVQFLSILSSIWCCHSFRHSDKCCPSFVLAILIVCGDISVCLCVCVCVNNFIYLLIFGCAGSLLLCRLFSSCSEWASHCGGSSCCRAQHLGCLAFSSSGLWAQLLWFPGSRAQAQWLWHTGLVAQQPGILVLVPQGFSSCISRMSSRFFCFL